MYLGHFKLTAMPFRLTPDFGFLFMSEAHTLAKSYMDYTVWNQEGFVVITGEIGSGKTTLIQKLLSELNEDVLVAKVFQTQLDEVEFLQAVLAEVGLDPFSAKKVELLDMLNKFLLKRFQQRRQIVLIVDDAHHLSMKVLEEIRMLAGLEAGKEKVLHVILVGQPQLDEILDDPGMDQLRQRVKLRYRIRPLNEEEVGAYIEHRLSVAGAKDTTLFPPETMLLISEYTGGIPRLINTLCDMALTCAYADGLPNITPEVMESAIKELHWPSYAERVERHRLAKPPVSAENAMLEFLREHSGTMAAIAGQAGKVELLAPALESISKSLKAIETHSAENAMREFLREQSGAMAAIAGQAGKVLPAPALESISKSLEAIETHLRNLARNQGTELRLESTMDSRKKLESTNESRKKLESTNESRKKLESTIDSRKKLESTIDSRKKTG